MAVTPVLPIDQLLDRRRRAHGAVPLLTYYDLDTGERTELSAATYGTWVDKTANLLLDLDVDPGDAVALPLLAARPAHWVSLVWVAAVWRVGATVELEPDRAAVQVVGPEPVTDPLTDPDVEHTVACSLHPLGLGLSVPPPDGVVDYVEVRGFPDAYLGVPTAGDPVAWAPNRPTSRLLDDTPTDVDARVLLAVDEGPGADPYPRVLDALVRPFRGTGSTVLVVGAADPERLARLAATEHATAR